MPHLFHTSLKAVSVVAVLAMPLSSNSIVDPPLQGQGQQLIVATAGSSSSDDPAKVSSSAAMLSASYGKLPISFEVNQGQATQPVQFLARGAGYTLYLTPGEAVLSLPAPPPDRAGSRGPGIPKALPSSAARVASTTPPATVRLQLIGANIAATAGGVDPLPGKSNYFIGSDPRKWCTDVPTYAKVRYSNVYPGIDLLYYGNQEGKLEHDFVVAPGADPNSIAIRLSGSDAIIPEQNGGLSLHTHSGDLVLHSPTVYQDINGQRKIIPATYLVAGNQVKFQLGSYDKKAPLVIDPVLKYSGTFGGSAPDYGEDIAVDATGNAYVTGWTQSPGDFPEVNPLQGPSQTFGSAFVSKVNAAGTALLYSTYLGTSSMTFAIAVDEAGRAYVTGSGIGIPTKNAVQPTPGNGVGNSFLTVLAPAGNSLIYSTYIGGASGSSSYGIALDASDNAYITGFCGDDFPTLHSIQAHGAVFVAKFSKAGGLLYSSVFGTQDTETYTGAIAVDALGSAYVTGSTNTVNFPVRKPAIQSVCPSCGPNQGSAFVTKLSPYGNSMVYSTYLGGPEFSSGSAIAVDSSGGAYVAGWTGSGFPVTTNALQKTYAGNTDGFVTKLNASGTGIVWSTYFGGYGGDAIFGMALDKFRNVYVIGSASSINLPLKSPLQGYVGQELCQNFVTTLSGSLNSIVYYSTYFGSGHNAFCYFPGIAVDKSLNVYVTGTSWGNIPTTPGAIYKATDDTNGNVFVSKLVIMDDLALGLSSSSASVTHGANLTYTLAVTSKGPDLGYNVRIDDPLPAGTTFVSYNAGGGTCTAPAIGATGTLHCALPTLEKGATYTVTLTVKVNAVAGTTLSNTATTVSNMQDFVQSNNKGTLTNKVL